MVFGSIECPSSKVIYNASKPSATSSAVAVCRNKQIVKDIRVLSAIHQMTQDTIVSMLGILFCGVGEEPKRKALESFVPGYENNRGKIGGGAGKMNDKTATVLSCTECGSL